MDMWKLFVVPTGLHRALTCKLPCNSYGHERIVIWVSMKENKNVSASPPSILY